MTKFHGALLGLATIGAIATGSFGNAVAQEQEMYDAIDCSQWTLNADGTWRTGPNAVIIGARRRFSNLNSIDMAGFFVNGIDVSAWLNAKCGKQTDHGILGVFFK